MNVIKIGKVKLTKTRMMHMAAISVNDTVIGITASIIE